MDLGLWFLDSRMHANCLVSSICTRQNCNGRSVKIWSYIHVSSNKCHLFLHVHQQFRYKIFQDFCVHLHEILGTFCMNAWCKWQTSSWFQDDPGKTETVGSLKLICRPQNLRYNASQLSMHLCIAAKHIIEQSFKYTMLQQFTIDFSSHTYGWATPLKTTLYENNNRMQFRIHRKTTQKQIHFRKKQFNICTFSISIWFCVINLFALYFIMITILSSKKLSKPTIKYVDINITRFGLSNCPFCWRFYCLLSIINSQ